MKKTSARQWYTAFAENDMTEAQRVWFEKSYNSYLKFARQKGVPEKDIHDTSSYFSEYKMERKGLIARGRNISNLPRYIASEQTFERSIFQDEAQYNMFRDDKAFQKKFGKVTKIGYRRLKQEDLDEFIYNDINKKRQELYKEGFDPSYVAHFISKEFFGSP